MFQGSFAYSKFIRIFFTLKGLHLSFMHRHMNHTELIFCHGVRKRMKFDVFQHIKKKRLFIPSWDYICAFIKSHWGQRREAFQGLGTGILEGCDGVTTGSCADEISLCLDCGDAYMSLHR